MSNHAIATLEVAAQNAAHNAPIHAAEGDAAQAALSTAVAADCSDAAAALQNASA